MLSSSLRTDTLTNRNLQSRDVNEGADFIMVKPALPYLDIISDCTTVAPDHPVACYQVSGEYAMVYAGAEKGIYDLKEMAFETTESMVRAGTFAPFVMLLELATWLTISRSFHHIELFHAAIP